MWKIGSPSYTKLNHKFYFCEFSTYFNFQMPSNCPNPMCSFTFDRRNCPSVCPQCKALLGGKNKEQNTAKREKAINSRHVTVDLGSSLYSVQYHQYNRYMSPLYISWHWNCAMSLKILKNTPTGASIKPKNFDSDKNLNLI